MDMIKLILSTIFLCTCFAIIGSQSTNDNLVNFSKSISEISKGSEEFALELFRRISDAVAPVGYDFMISPFSIWSLLILVTEGSNGNTLAELRRVLRINQDVTSIREGYKQIQNALQVNTSTVQVSVIQALFTDLNRPLNLDYESNIQNTYRANVQRINFQDVSQAQTAINGFVEKATRGLIDYIVNEEDLYTAQMVLISAIFFKGQWKNPFNRSLTTREPFYDENEKISGYVNMMFQRGEFLFTGINAIDSHVLELPYGIENRLAMIILLPKKGSTLNNVVEKLAKYGIANIYAELRKSMPEVEEDEIEVYMPRFSSTSDFVMNIILEQMGILDLFDVNHADLSKMTTSPIFLSRVFHKTRIEVNEEGTTATAATGGTFANKATPPRFYINKPFAYLIIEKTTNSLLFCGQVRNPAKFAT